MSELINRQIRLNKRPKGEPSPDDFKMAETSVPPLNNGQMLIQTLYLSVDPGMRGMMEDKESYTPPFSLNDVLTGRSIGRVIDSKNENFAIGDMVYERLGWQDYSISDGENAQKVDQNLTPISSYLGVLGVPGLCAYFGLFEIGQPKKGETVVVSGASGAVGMAAGQLAKHQGCRVIGIAGSNEKNHYLKEELGFDATINYKTTTDMGMALQEACPEGIDIYFDNVGGEITHAALTLINYHARIIICGQTSQYNLEHPPMIPGNFDFLIKKSALMKGFVVYDYADRNDEAVSYLARLMNEGELTYEEHIVEGLENAPQAFMDLFKSKSFGKQLVKLSD
ncbi:NADP-dependent oxidoreductase [Lentibacillus halophilus]|uniref:NADP-dependent oxidoreductase n=1 Tax=Lentibacillus halophilus TaxID=295065 RepID=A0ABP3JE07_9BACI